MVTDAKLCMLFLAWKEPKLPKRLTGARSDGGLKWRLEQRLEVHLHGDPRLMEAVVAVGHHQAAVRMPRYGAVEVPQAWPVKHCAEGRSHVPE